MASLVLELQRDALDKDVSIGNLLRKALVVARKLKVAETIDWISHELNGYPDGIEVPAYRRLRGELKVHNPYHGWVPLFMSDPKQAEILSKRGTSQSISELEEIVSGDGEIIYVKLPRKIEQSLMKGMEFPLEPAVILSKSQIHGLLDRVRNTVLEWALSLEEKGITGEGMTFSNEEQRQASNLTFNVSHVGALIGSMQDSQLQQGTHASAQNYTKAVDLDAVARIVTELQKRIDEARLESDDQAQLQSDIGCIETQLKAPKPNISIIKESLRSVRSILEGAAGSAVFQGLISAIGGML